MAAELYNKSVAEDIFSGARYFRVDDRGVWLDVGPRDETLAVEMDQLHWHPLAAIYERGLPDPRDNPSLPIPFTAGELAAVFLHGTPGEFAVERFGDLEDGLDEDALQSLLPSSPKAQEVIRDAFAAYRAAKAAVDGQALATAGRIKSEMYLSAKTIAGADRPRLETDEAWREYSNAIKAENFAEKEWLKAMVQHLLSQSGKPAFATPPQAGSEASRVRNEKKLALYDRLLLEILNELGIDPYTCKRHKGGATKNPAKEKAFQLALTPRYTARGFKESGFKGAWERLPKLD